MSKFVETPSGKVVLTLRITFDPERDADLLAALRAAPPRRLAAVARQLLRSGVSAETVGADEDDWDLSGLGMEL